MPKLKDSFPLILHPYEIFFSNSYPLFSKNIICYEQTSLLCFLSRFAARIVVRLLVVDLEAGKQRVLEADVHADHVEHDGVGLVGLQRGRDGQTGLSVPKM